jgi:putative membrane protein
MEVKADIRGLFIAGCVFAGLLAAIHIYIFVLESILWRKRAAKAFRLPQSTVDITTGLAANQGVYNLILAVGLIWGLAELNADIMLFFLAAIFNAGVFGAITASPRILLIQVIPSLIGYIFVSFGYYSKGDWSYWKHPLYLLIILTGAGLITVALAFIIKKYFLKNISDQSPKSPSASDNL